MISSLLSVEEASWKSVGGDAYTARWRESEPSPEGCVQSHRTYNLVHICFEEGVTDVMTTPVAAVVPQETTPTRATDNQTPPLTSGNQLFTAEGSNHGTSDEKEGCTRPTEGSLPVSSFPGNGNLSPTSMALFVGSPCTRDQDCLQALRAVGRAAMVGFHGGLVGAVRDISWGKSGLITIVDAGPSGCLTLQEMLRGALYRESGIGNSGRGVEAGGASDVGGLGVVGVISRMLTLTRQIAAAMAHCHRRGVSCSAGT